MRESAGSGIREISDAEGRPPARTSEGIQIEFYLSFRLQQASSGRLVPQSLPRTTAAHSAARSARLRQDSAGEEKAWIRKDGGEQRAFGRRRRYLIVCVIGGAALERMLWSFSPGAPPPPPPPLSPLSVRTHPRRFLLIFPCLGFCVFFPIPSSSHPFLFLPPFLPPRLPQEKGLSLRVHSGP